MMHSLQIKSKQNKAGETQVVSFGSTFSLRKEKVEEEL
jgi:hypothetical protein